MASSSSFRLSAADHAKVSAAVAAAEAHSAGEIVTIVTDRSDGYTDVAMAWAVLAAVTALTAFSLRPEFSLAVYDRLLGDWGSEWSHRGILVLATALAVGKFIAMMVLQMWQPFKFALIPGIVKSARVRARAVSCFKVGAERRTHGRTGIVIFLSMREHRAEIVADQAIADKVSPEVWGAAMAAMLGHIRAGQTADGLAAAVEQVGAVLAQHFPRTEEDKNELPDRLIEV